MDLWFVSQLLLWIVAVALALLTVGVARLTRQIEAEPVRGSNVIGQAPGATTLIEVVSGRRVQLPAHDRPGLLVFISPSCSECRHVLPLVNQAREHFGGRVDTYVIAAAEEREAWAYATSQGGALPILADGHGEVARAYGVTRVPFAVATNSTGEVRGAVGLTTANASSELIRLIGLATAPSAATPISA